MPSSVWVNTPKRTSLCHLVRERSIATQNTGKKDPELISEGSGVTTRIAEIHPVVKKPLTEPKNLSSDNPNKGTDGAWFATKAKIPIWGKKLIATPERRDSYNDDLVVERYVKSVYHVAGNPRSGISECIIGAREDHMIKAGSAEFFLAKETKLPADLESALKFHVATPPNEIRKFRAQQAAWLASLSTSANPTQAEWGGLIPPEISYSANGIRTATLATLLSDQGMGGQKWASQFIFGFPIVGRLAQSGVPPPSTKPIEKPISPDILFYDATARFAARSKRSSTRETIPLWEEALAKVQRGWLGQPEIVTEAGRSSHDPDAAINLAFRFGARHLDRMRACDDFKNAHTNRACAIETPKNLVDWGHIAQLALKGASSRPGWSFFKEDRASAYKWLPLQPDRARYATATLRSPVDNRWYSFRPRALMFGSASSVLHYTCLSRIIASLACRLLGIPTVGYIDDFGAICRTELLSDAILAVRALRHDIGVARNPGKADAGNVITPLGLQGEFPSPSNDRVFKIPPPKKRLQMGFTYRRNDPKREIQHAR